MLTDLKACHCCGQIQHTPPLAPRQLAACARCGSTVCRYSTHSASRTAALATAAFILYWPAILLPILQIERLGRHHQSSLLMGTIDLLREGSWFVGTVVLLFSIVFPLVKIVLLLELSLLGIMHRKHKAITYRIMEQAGKWSMMDVMLIAFMVMLVKLGSLVEFHFGPAVWAFVLCVAMSMWASLSFDPHSIWGDERA
ncbi:paraquat-inducible protein A [Bythopirellula goksoeyrii]|uniref:Paraquat-inducible protein A n=1 Tax=Bythopirellula goksoeyrii TaxID=1400387 RepID=A0A5B9QD05_9BACT|nr:paraquat-inducible protein A [Bythopirellula goksoeyrii]QEG35500.1 Paraquat-inducible protein A [Bythopirellula goksoeyrii]